MVSKITSIVTREVQRVENTVRWKILSKKIFRETAMTTNDGNSLGLLQVHQQQFHRESQLHVNKWTPSAVQLPSVILG